eukprot:TRINITY_DN545_c0_g2_i1.p1 TRINITY_DN545_c0_g2~~TRINITY_DN545_c0_g2_i1.p1  ORF type:complete len:310 (-),score=43.93 TRINITY_DN545_c0_g2_i1:236-1078(-)
MDSAVTTEGKFNPRSPAVKRILQEMKELKNDTSQEYVAEALEDNIFEWYFVIRGPVDTEFEGGFYHGRIILPAEYPFKPPSFIMLSPNGRFEVGRKICLSISERHPEEWQPSWSLRTALTALIAFLPTPGKGALGSLDFPKEDRKILAAKSRMGPPSHGNQDRQTLISRLHNEIMKRQQHHNHQTTSNATTPQNSPNSSQQNNPKSSSQSQIQPQNNRQQNQNTQLQNQNIQQQNNGRSTGNQSSRPDRSTAVVVALAVAIFALLAKKLIQQLGFNVLQL